MLQVTPVCNMLQHYTLPLLSATAADWALVSPLTSSNRPYRGTGNKAGGRVCRSLILYLESTDHRCNALRASGEKYKCPYFFFLMENMGFIIFSSKLNQSFKLPFTWLWTAQDVAVSVCCGLLRNVTYGRSSIFVHIAPLYCDFIVLLISVHFPTIPVVELQPVGGVN